MLTISRILQMLFLFTLFISSCKKDKELLYSCDEGLNEFVVHNSARLGGADRADLASYSTIDSQMAIFRSLDSTRKLAIFIEKIQLEIDSSTKLSTAEKLHLQKIIDFMLPQYYDSANKYVLDSFVTQWESDAKYSFDWSDREIFLYSQTWLTEEELDEIWEKPPFNPQTVTLDCNCRLNLACSWGLEDCNKGGCNLEYGCGFMGIKQCQGRCTLGGLPN